MKKPWTLPFVPKAAAAAVASAPSSGAARLGQATCDPLTGLPNRRAIRRHIRSKLQADAPHGRVTTALHIDLDGFAHVDAALGGAGADRVIRIVASRIAGCLSSADMLARLDGDEFLVVLGGNVATGKGVETLSATLRAAIARPIGVAGQDVHITGCIGIAQETAGPMKAEALVRNAARAARRAKAAGPGSCTTCGPADAAADESRQAIGRNLRSAIQRDALGLVFQPQMDLRSGAVVGVEARLCWDHPPHGALGPETLIPIAEDIGMIGVLGDWVIGAACAQMRAWRQAGVPLARLTVNVSVDQLQGADFSDRLSAALARDGVDPCHFGIALTGHRVPASPDACAAQLRRVRAAGVHIVLGGFGTGSWSLNCLSGLPIDALKIDRSLINTITSSAQTQSIARAIIALAHGLGMKTLAEGVQNDGQLEFLAASRCDQFQRQFFGPDVDANEMARMLRDGARVRVPQGRRSDGGKTILILDDEPSVVNRLSAQIVRRFGSEVRVETCASATDALMRLSRMAVDIVISDLRMPGCDGVDFLAKARRIQPDLVCMMLVGPGEAGALIDDTRQTQVFRYLPKPWDPDLLLRHVEAALAHAVQLDLQRVGVEAALLARCGTPDDTAWPQGIGGRAGLGEMPMPQSLPTLPGDLWALARH